MKLRPVLAFAAVGSLGALVGCVVINKEHCAYAGGTECVGGTVCSMCAVENNGCVAMDAIEDDKCIFLDAVSSSSGAGPTTDPSTTDSGTTALPTTGTSTTDPVTTEGSTSTTEPTTLTDPDTGDTTSTSSTTSPPCMGEPVDNPGCGGVEPYCVDMECVSCEGLSSCVDFEPSKPACEAKSGRCVECLTNDDCIDLDEPACDADTATCVPCTEHAQCPATACNLETGRCFPDSDVLYVSNEIGNCSDVKLDYGFDVMTPICTLSTAMKRVAPGKPTTIKLKPNIKAQHTPAGLPIGNYVVAIVPQDEQLPSLAMTNELPAVTLSPGNQVFMLRVGIYNSMGASDPAIDCTGATLWLDRQRIYNTRTAILADNCLVHLRRTIIFGNVGGGLEIGGDDPAQAMLWLENSFLTENHGSAFGGLRLRGAASAELLYTTVANNKSPVPPIDCVAGWSGKLELRNSAIVDPGAHFAAACKPTLISTFESMLKVDIFSSSVGGFYEAKKNGPLAGKAIWKTGDPVTDYNDTKRPTMNGELDYAGGDRPGM